ncbi:MAG: HlyC/CorC family transporter [Verrucomicrobia bacterium]|nr:HlyC/CorC family transporter [Verrucomicrobiota bacterium]
MAGFPSGDLSATVSGWDPTQNSKLTTQSILMEGFILSILIFANGLFAMAELAVVSSRRSKLKQKADAGDHGAKAAYDLACSPSSLLSTVSVAITMIAVLSGAMGGAVLAKPLAQRLEAIYLPASVADPLALGVVVFIITAASIIFGELLPKRLALAHSEVIASRLSRPIQAVAAGMGPIVKLFSWVTDTLAALFGVRGTGETAPVSDEELRHLLEQGQRAGVFSSTEQGMVERVLRLDELRVEELMTPSVRIVWINAEESPDVTWRALVASGHSHFPVYQGSRENVVGVVSVKALWANTAAGLPARVALVSDEFGSITGILSLLDLLEAIVGDLPSHEDRQRARVVKREDGSWLVDATLPVEDFAKELGKGKDHFHLNGDYQTLGGFVVHHLARVPKEGDSFEYRGHRYEVVDMDRHRLDKLLVAPSRN